MYLAAIVRSAFIFIFLGFGVQLEYLCVLPELLFG